MHAEDIKTPQTDDDCRTAKTPAKKEPEPRAEADEFQLKVRKLELPVRPRGVLAE